MSDLNIDFDFSSLESGDFALGKGAQTERINYIGNGKTTWPMDVRLVVNTSSKDEAKPYIETHQHGANVGGQYVVIPCNRSFNMPCAICDAHWEHKGKAQALETKGGKTPGHALHNDWKRSSLLADLFKQERKFSMLAVLRGDNKISWLSAKPSLTKAIFGDKQRGIRGAIDQIKEFGVSVFNPSEPTGWLTLNKTGTGLDTVYSAKPTMITKVEGKRKSEELSEGALPSSVLEQFKDPSNMIKIYESTRARLWSEEEIQNFVDSEGTQIPDRVKKKVKESSKSDDTFTEPAIETVSFDETSGLDPF